MENLNEEEIKPKKKKYKIIKGLIVVAFLVDIVFRGILLR